MMKAKMPSSPHLHNAVIPSTAEITADENSDPGDVADAAEAIQQCSLRSGNDSQGNADREPANFSCEFGVPE